MAYFRISCQPTGFINLIPTEVCDSQDQQSDPMPMGGSSTDMVCGETVSMGDPIGETVPMGKPATPSADAKCAVAYGINKADLTLLGADGKPSLEKLDAVIKAYLHNASLYEKMAKGSVSHTALVNYDRYLCLLLKYAIKMQYGEVIAAINVPYKWERRLVYSVRTGYEFDLCLEHCSDLSFICNAITRASKYGTQYIAEKLAEKYQQLCGVPYYPMGKHDKVMSSIRECVKYDDLTCVGNIFKYLHVKYTLPDICGNKAAIAINYAINHGSAQMVFVMVTCAKNYNMRVNNNKIYTNLTKYNHYDWVKFFHAYGFEISVENMFGAVIYGNTKLAKWMAKRV